MFSYVGAFAATYVAVQTVTFTECDPFNHYWMVLPDPGITSSLGCLIVEASNKTQAYAARHNSN